ncbi:MAG: membrane protein insertion efficiency factor YidD [Methylophilaceae bacterium]
MGKLFIGFIKLYQWCLSPFIGSNCRFEPSCSHYAIEAINRYGAFKGVGLGVMRLGRCHPWCEGGHDPVP